MQKMEYPTGKPVIPKFTPTGRMACPSSDIPRSASCFAFDHVHARGLMRRGINFTKMVASGNDFIVIENKGRVLKTNGLVKLARVICARKFGAGADGLLVMERSRKADTRMRIFNADGSEAEMCGNGARCVALYMSRQSPRKNINIETQAGIIQSRVGTDSIRIKLTDPRGLRLDIPLQVNNRSLKVNFINTGVPHAVIFCAGLDKIDINAIAPSIRYHKYFLPRGTNVNFVEALRNDAFRIRTYERGVEDETLACGTGSVAAALIFAVKSGAGGKIHAHTKSGEVLNVYFSQDDSRFHDVWLEGKARIVFKGQFSI